MALIDCVECGKQISDQAAACPSCGVPMGAPSSVKSEHIADLKKEVRNLRRPQAAVAGEELGEGIGGAIAWLATNEYMALVWVWMAGVFGMFSLFGFFGYTSESTSNDTYGVIVLIALIVPIVAVWFLRKPIRKVVPPVLGAAVGLGAIALYVAFFGALIYIAYRMLS